MRAAPLCARRRDGHDVADIPSVPLTGDAALCSSGRSPQQVVAGPDGAVWFTAASGEVGRMTTAGGLSLAPVPGTGTRLPESIVVGPDERSGGPTRSARRSGG